MRKALVPVVCLTLLVAVLAAGALADVATITIRPGENWISLPLVPFDPTPTSVLFGLGIHYTITRFDVQTATPMIWDPQSPSSFGNLLLGDGYIVTNPTSQTFVETYNGVPDGVPSDPNDPGTMTDMLVSLPGNPVDGVNAGGMNWIGQPFYHDTPISSIQVISELGSMTMQQAVAAGWLDGVWTTWDSVTQTGRTVGLQSFNPDDTWLRAGMMYKVTTHMDNIALIIPAAVPEPSSLVTLLCGVSGLSGMIIRRRK